MWTLKGLEILEDFREYHERYGGKGLKIVAINIDGENLDVRQRREIRDFAAGLNLPYTLLYDENLAVFVSYGVMAHPSAVLVGKGGKIVYSLGGYPLSLREELEEEIQKTLGLYVLPPAAEQSSVTKYVARNGALQYFNLGRNLAAKGQRERARSAFAKALERDPAFIEPAVMIARLSLAEGAVEEAEALLKSVDASLINRNDLRYMLGFLMLLKESDEKAEGAFNSLAKRSDGTGWSNWGLGLVRLSSEEKEEALRYFHEAAVLQPSNPEAAGFIRRHLVAAWREGRSLTEEEELTALFPVLSELRSRYRRMFRLQMAAD